MPTKQRIDKFTWKVTWSDMEGEYYSFQYTERACDELIARIKRMS